jgi:transposase
VIKSLSSLEKKILIKVKKKMSGKITRMSKIKQLMLLHQQGESNRKIAQMLALDKGTVNKFVNKLQTHDLSIEELLQMEDPVLESQFLAGRAAYKDERYETLETLLPYFEQELSRKYVTRKIIWEEYIDTHRDGYGYSQFCFHLAQLLEARKPTATLWHNPGEKLYVDFAGDTFPYVNRETGEVKEAQVFVATLPYSNYTFIMAVASQKTEDFLHALFCCLSTLGGVTKILVPDNLKAAVTKSDKYEPDINRVMEDFANHYGFVVCPARAYKPRDKASVENSVKIIYQWVYAPLRKRMFYSLEDINIAFTEEIKKYNQTRMQQKNYTREEKFLAEEKQKLAPLPEKIFEVKYYADLRVGNNNYIYLGRDKHYYSVPYQYIGEKVSVIYTRTLVQIYCKGHSIAVHQRVEGFGYTTQSEHLCSTHLHYKERSPYYYIQTAERRSAVLCQLMKLIFEQTQTPETVYRRCDGLLSLQRQTDPDIFDRACQIAIDHNILTLKFVENVMKHKTYLIHQTTLFENPKPLPKHDNIRGGNYYN